MRTQQTLKERIQDQRNKLMEISRTIHRPREEYGRDTEAQESHFVGPVNWNRGWGKGWGKYGKT